jgi:hypothetical protein
MTSNGSIHMKLALLGLSLFAVTGQAGTIYNFSGTVTGDSESASATFNVSNCNATGCQLDVIITNNVTNPANAAFGIQGLSFNVASLNSGGALKVNGSNVAEVTNGSGGSVNSVDFGTKPGTVTTTNLAPNWSFGYSTGSAAGCLASNAFCLNGHSLGGQPFNLIIGGGPYTAFNPSLGNHSPDLGGPVDFEIDNFTGLTADTVFTNVQMDFGTNPDGSITCVAGAACNVTVQTTSSTPEPLSLLLTGTGLLAFCLLRRRSSATA